VGRGTLQVHLQQGIGNIGEEKKRTIRNQVGLKDNQAIMGSLPVVITGAKNLHGTVKNSAKCCGCGLEQT